MLRASPGWTVVHGRRRRRHPNLRLVAWLRNVDPPDDAEILAENSGGDSGGDSGDALRSAPETPAAAES